MQAYSSLGVTLTEGQIGELNERVDEFRAADYGAREQIAYYFFNRFKSTWPQGNKFDDVLVATVCALPTTLGSSHIFS
jgi:hypothetical protein